MGSRCHEGEDDDIGRDKRRVTPGLNPDLPDDILRYIHSLMPLRYAARAACVSQTFLQCWRCYPNLTFSSETLVFDGKLFNGCEERTRYVTNRVDQIMQNHSGIGVRTLKFDLQDCGSIDLCHVDRWLHNALAPGVEELTLMLPSMEYNFPRSLLSNGSGISVEYLHLSVCSLHPRVALGCLRNLKRVHLRFVWITGDELECLLSNSLALEQLNLMYCNQIICLKIPRLSQRLSILQVTGCERLQSIESDAPNLSTFMFNGNPVHFSLGNSSEVKNLAIECFHKANIVRYARTTLLSTAPNVETLTILSQREVNTQLIKHASIYDDPDPSHLREMPGLRHDKLKSVKITGFCSYKSMIEFACHIVENAASLEHLTLDTTDGSTRCSISKSGKCHPMGSYFVREAQRTLLAIKTYIEGKVPSTVKFNALGPSSQCHYVENYARLSQLSIF